MTIPTEETIEITFNQFGLKKELTKAINELGYEIPSPIQQKTIPLLLEGKDIIGQAQTGTGKTAAFALPILQKIDVKNKYAFFKLYVNAIYFFIFLSLIPKTRNSSK